MENGKKSMKGTELNGKNLGLIGFGRIAQGVANVAKALGMEIHTYDPYLPPKVANLWVRICTKMSIVYSKLVRTYRFIVI